MTKRELPTPVLVEHEFLAAILEELVGLRADQARAHAPEAVKEFREPEATKASARRKDPPEPKSKRQRKKE